LQAQAVLFWAYPLELAMAQEKQDASWVTDLRGSQISQVSDPGAQIFAPLH
jgi:hypothetical protein